MTTEIIAGFSIGPYKLGMNRNEVKKSSGNATVEFFKSVNSGIPCEHDISNGIIVHFERQIASYIEIALESQCAYRINGRLLNGNRYTEIKYILTDLSFSFNEDNDGFSCNVQGINGWTPVYDGEETEVKSLGIFPPDGNQ